MSADDRFDPTRRRVATALVTSTLLPTLLPRAHAQGTPAARSWPARPLSVIVGYPPGSSPDVLARLLAEPLAKALGQPVVVDNRSGAGGNIGVDAVLKSSDGHTIGFTGNGPLTTSKALYAKLAFDPERDLRPVSLVASTPFVLVGQIALPASMKELLARLRSQGDKLSYGSIGVGSGAHLLMELFKSRMGLRLVHVPYRGNPAIVTALLAGEVEVAFMVPSVAMPHVKSGKLRLFGASTATRSPLLPDVPTIAEEAGIADFDVEAWNGVFAPASMPDAHVRLLSDEIATVLRGMEIRQRLQEQGWRALGLAADGLASRMRDETRMYAAIIKSVGITAE